jgi:MFS family permease
MAPTPTPAGMSSETTPADTPHCGSPSPDGLDKTPAPHPPPRQSRGWRFYAAFACLCLVSFLTALDATIISVAVPTIAKDINATAIEAFWMGTSFLLASTVFQPTFASFSHIFGRQPVLLAALSLFTVGSVLCAVAHNVALMLAGRVVQGIGAGGLLALTYVIATDLVTLRERGKWFSLISLTWAIGSVMGPVVGGALAEKEWRWIFWINLPFCGITFVAIPVVLTLRRKSGTFDKKLWSFDWAGAVIFIASLTAILIPLSWGEWTSGGSAL